jgi:photosystem II stability/assembly factor-like uncharacterized protein
VLTSSTGLDTQRPYCSIAMTAETQFLDRTLRAGLLAGVCCWLALFASAFGLGPLPGEQVPIIRTPTVVNDIVFADAVHGWIEVAAVNGSGSFLLRTQDGGETWSRIPLKQGLYRVFFLDQNLGWGLGLARGKNPDRAQALFVTRDGGAAWNYESALPETGVQASAHVASLCFVDAEHGFVIGEGTYGAGLAFRTLDGGKTLQKVEEFTDAQGSTRGVFSDGRQRVWVTGADGLRLTDDWGDTWRGDLKWTGKHPDLSSGEMLAGRTGVVVGGSGQGFIFRTSDNGASWHLSMRSDLAHSFRSVSFWDAAHGCAVGASRLLFCTSDAGQHWDERDVLPDKANSIENKGRFFQKIAFSGGGKHAWLLDSLGVIYQSDNQGARWNRMPLSAR